MSIRPIGLAARLFAAALALLAFLLFMPRVAQAATIVVGGNVINQTWTAAGSPYIVQGDIVIPNNAYLVPGEKSPIWRGFPLGGARPR